MRAAGGDFVSSHSLPSGGRRCAVFMLAGELHYLFPIVRRVPPRRASRRGAGLSPSLRSPRSDDILPNRAPVSAGSTCRPAWWGLFGGGRFQIATLLFRLEGA